MLNAYTHTPNSQPGGYLVPRMWPIDAACSADAPKIPPRLCYYHRMSTTPPTNSARMAPLMPQAAHHMHLSHCRAGVVGRCLCLWRRLYSAHACRLPTVMLHVITGCRPAGPWGAHTAGRCSCAPATRRCTACGRRGHSA